jgi:hypothetical protein
MKALLAAYWDVALILAALVFFSFFVDILWIAAIGFLAFAALWIVER